MIRSKFSEHTKAVDRVERLLRRTAEALEQSGISYAVVGGNAVAIWIGSVDPEAVRTTKDVDLLVDQKDVDRITEALEAIGLTRVDLRRITLFLDPEKPDKKSGVHLVWSGVKVWPSNEVPTPTLEQVTHSEDGLRVIELGALVQMKLVADRYHDRAHIMDLYKAGLVTEEIRDALPEPLLDRLDMITSESPPDLLEE
ncbi:MAG: hypothetical protein AAF711_01700 [Planctomycetota bacterium]